MNEWITQSLKPVLGGMLLAEHLGGGDVPPQPVTKTTSTDTTVLPHPNHHYLYQPITTVLWVCVTEHNNGLNCLTHGSYSYHFTNTDPLRTSAYNNCKNEKTPC